SRDKMPSREDLRRRDPSAPLPIPSSIESAIAQRMQQEDKKSKLQVRLVHAGLYQKNAARALILLRIFAAIAPVGVGFLMGSLEVLPMGAAVMLGTLVGFAGT